MLKRILCMALLVDGKHRSVLKDPILVYCHIKPAEEEFRQICVKPKDETTVAFSVPCASNNSNKVKEAYYSFSHVFSDQTTQKEMFDCVVLPLIQDLLQGRNGLLFAYEILSREKIHIMTGTSRNGGMLPRCLDVIFNSIRGYQTNYKFVLQPDKLNSSEVLSISEVTVCNQKGPSINGTTKVKRKEILSEFENRVPDFVAVDICPNIRYAVFVSYVEIFNSYIYDLLEDCETAPKQSKMLREDSDSNMFVSGATKKEVKTTKEALEIFENGQLRRTTVNSHSVFTIRVIQVPLDSHGAELLQDNDQIIISQLSLVDLSVWESFQAKNISQKLGNYGSKNRSLMTLRTCIQTFRESLSQGISKVVPYRESKLTHLFKSFFEGKGKIRMIISVDPTRKDYGKTMNPLKFAERSQDVFISSSTSVYPPMTPDLKSGCCSFTYETVKDVKMQMPDIEEFSAMGCLHERELNYNNLINLLNSRQLRRNTLVEDLSGLQENFRKSLITVDKENMQLKQEKNILQMDLNAREQQIKNLERRLSFAELSTENLEKQVLEYQHQAHILKLELENKDKKMTDQTYEFESMKAKMQEKLSNEKNKRRRIMEKRLAAKLAELQRKLCFSDEKLRQIREILNADDWDCNGDINIPLAPSSVTSAGTSEISAHYTRSKRTSPHDEICVQNDKNSISLHSKNNYDSAFVKKSKLSSDSQKCSTHMEFQDNSISVCTESMSCVSKKQDLSLVELEEKSISICTESTSKFSRKRKKSFVSMIKKRNMSEKKAKNVQYSSSKANSSKTKEHVLTTKKQNISVFSIKKENLSNFPIKSETEIKTFSNLPYVYKMNSGLPERSYFSSLRNFLSRSFTCCIKNIASVNLYQKRSLPNSCDLWIEHKPVGNLELNTVLQPALRKKISVCKLLVEDFANNNVSKYILQHQEQDSCGVLETQLFKGDIIHSSGGGVQVVFKDIEKLRQVSPPSNYVKKRSGESLPLTEVENRCTVSVECHGRHVNR